MVDPQKLLPFLLRPEIAGLDPDIIAVYIQSATKIFGHWSADLADHWTDDHLPDVKAMAKMVVEQVERFTGSSNVEVQERVRPPSP
jgi:AP-3 complex subunit delta